ncbi:capsular polysaccharide export protein, LipB/KpsS family [Desertibacillus haloalkaliphilus]|uniref:capsular polysaccharide export protein, LipB/KpsS family n=1 Tax=Desertibacillus haloalkaliphilus TaxID=1328930 RepID=UPI001C279DAA|nr:UDP-N-acetylglucosamine 2-epimerase [Desertibacillus haloalkaliphilus]MBU8907592.1 UDP-N-acetylglucosamine 2-epimerase [Desertibacillus haloalkaliphilus]
MAEKRFKQLQNHIVFGDSYFQKKFIKVIPSITRDVVAMDQFLSEVPISCVLVSDSGNLRVPQLHPRSWGIPTISLQHGLLLTWQARMPVLATKKAVYGQFEMDLFKGKGVNKESIVITGHPRFDESATKKEQSIQLKESTPLKVLIATQPKNNKKVWEKFIEYAIKEFQVSIVIKPHPKERSIKEYKKLSNKYPQVVVSSRKSSLYDAMQQSDVVIVNSSTVGLEAMLCNKPVLILEMEHRLSEGAKRYFSPNLLGELVQSNHEKLANCLGKLITEKQMINYTAKKRNQFLSYVYPKSNQSSGDLLVQLIEELTRRDLTPEKECKGVGGSMNVRELISKQFNDDVFNRVDLIVRYLAIEDYYGKNNYGFKLYKKMQKNRSKHIAKTYLRRKRKFKELIESVEKQGLKKDSYVNLDSKSHLLDGSHRVACALYFNIDEIPIQFREKRKKIDYSINWFKNNGFTEEEIKLILDKQTELFDYISKS